MTDLLQHYSISLPGDCSIREYRSKELSMCNAFECVVQFEHFTYCTNVEYQSNLDELSSAF